MKTETKPTHTPGPWQHRLSYDHDLNAVAYVHTVAEKAPGVQQGICVTINVGSGYLETQQESNARLIAAAPDLLAMSARALDYLDRIEEGSEGAELRDALRAAIAKAEGK